MNGLVEIGDFGRTGVYNEYLSKYLRYVINQLDFIDYGIMQAQTEVYFDEPSFTIVIESTYYFEYVQIAGINLLETFMSDPIFFEWLKKQYERIAERNATALFKDGADITAIFNPNQLQPRIVVRPTLDYEQVRALQKNIGVGRHSG